MHLPVDSLPLPDLDPAPSCLSSEESISISYPSSSASSSDAIAGCRNANKSLSLSRCRILQRLVWWPSEETLGTKRTCQNMQ